MTRIRRLMFALVMVVGLTGCQQGQDLTAQQPQLPAPESSEGRAPKLGASGKVREPAVAGSFYPDDEAALAKMVDGFLAEVKESPAPNLRGLVCPHAGYRYSGPVAAVGYKLLQGRRFETVIVLAPSHRVAFAGASIPDAAAFRTPLGKVPLAPQAAELAKRRPFSIDPLTPLSDDSPHAQEHSLEVQLPFLQRTLKEFALVPIVLGRVDPELLAKELAGLADDKTLLVASSDLSHYQPYEAARQADAACVEAICRMDIERMEQQDACGKGPILTLMHVAKRKGWKAKLLDYRNSGDTAGDKSAVVGYTAIAFFQDDKAKTPDAGANGRCTPPQRKLLLELARKSLVECVHGRGIPEVDPGTVPEKFKSLGGCFVTLTKDGALRGCIGHIIPQAPLYKAVLENAKSAALDDFRFPPVRRNELDQIRIEVSLLSVPKPLDFQSPEELLEKLRPHVDGVVLSVGGRQATYLPQVWEQIPEKESFLNQLAEKAGLPAAAWKTRQARVLTYQVEAFHEGEVPAQK